MYGIFVMKLFFLFLSLIFLISCGGESGDSNTFKEEDTPITPDNPAPNPEPVPINPIDPDNPQIKIIQLSSGNNHSCAVTENNDVYCWGGNESGQLGNGSFENSFVPTLIENFKFKQISSGNKFTCGIDLSDEVYCWGSNSYRQLGKECGTGQTCDRDNNENSPIKVSPIEFKLVSVGDEYACAIGLNDELAYCWGRNTKGTLGQDSDTFSISQPTPVSNPISGQIVLYKNISAGSFQTCAISFSNDVYCWGSNERGGTGQDINIEGSDIPIEVDSIPSNSAEKIVSGTFSVCMIDGGRQLFCWGDNSAKELYEPSPDILAPQIINIENQNIQKIALSLSSQIISDNNQSHSCALSSSNVIYCFGSNNFGQLGTRNLTVNRNEIKDILFSDVSVGYQFSCGLNVDQTQILCWGSNDVGQLGRAR